MNHMQDQLKCEGRACYKRQEYTTALEHFSRAIGRAPTVQLLDSRAACHDKLLDLPAALKDAKKAIQLQREDPTGYLRAGKTLVKMEKQNVALEIYTHGLKSVKHIGQGYERLRKVQAELMSQLSSSTSVDPLTVLPRELAELILAYLNFRQRINACLVSKQWAGFVRSSSTLWQHLDLSLAKRKVRNAFVSRAINTGRQKLTAVTLSNMYDLDKALNALVTYCPLEELTLLETGLQGPNLFAVLKRAKHLKSFHIGPGTQVSSSTLTDILNMLQPQLQELSYKVARDVDIRALLVGPEGQRLPLETLRLTIEDVSPDLFLFLSSLPARCPDLRVLCIHCGPSTRRLPPVPVSHISDFSTMEKLIHFETSIPWWWAGSWRRPPSLRRLRVTGLRPTASFFQSPVSAEENTRWNLPDLEELALECVSTPVSDFTLALAGEDSHDSISPQSSQLRCLEVLSPLTELDDLESLLSHKRLHDLRQFTLRATSCDDGTVALIVKKLENLDTIDLGGTAITGVSLKTLLSLQGIKYINVRGCRFLGRDAVEWARDQGVKVDCNGLAEQSGGNKVRF